MQPQHSALPVFLFFNLAFAVGALAGLIILSLVLGYGLFFSGDQGGELAAGVAGTLIVMLPLVIVAFLGLTAAIGLHRRTRWGYAAHIALAATLAFTCVAAPYTLIALSVSLGEPFRRALFGPPYPSPRAGSIR
jgi:hypothetical protein